MALDPRTCRIWFSKLRSRFTPPLSPGGEVCALEPDGSLVGCYSHGNPVDERAQGLAVDAAGNVWVAHSQPSATTIGRLRTDGTLMKPVPLKLGAAEGIGPTGVAVDVNGKIWVTNRDSDNVMRIDPNAGPDSTNVSGFKRGAVDLVVPLRPDSKPYNDSDMTGFISRNNPPNSFWTATQDGGAAGTRWCKVCWNQESTGKGAGGIKVEVRAADTLNTGQWTEVANCQPLLGLEGRYLDVRVTLVRELDPAVECGLSPETPILTDITLEACCSCPEGTEEGQIGLDYPGRDCAAAISSAQNPAALNMPLYRNACEEVVGAEVPNGVLSAQATACDDSPGGGAFVAVELCCAPPPP
ncbi:MAG: hypothetical protein GY953_11620, partial [bacterium]|nr:hypothetical protein [bacterium]